jgi:hypothetical protein
MLCNWNFIVLLLSDLEFASSLSFSTSYQVPPPYVQNSVMRVAIKMHSSHRKWEASTESPDTVGSPWMCLLFENNYAFR